MLIFLHLVALLALQCWRLVVMQVVQLESLFREEKLAAGVAWDVRVPRVDDLMCLQARIVVERWKEK